MTRVTRWFPTDPLAWAIVIGIYGLLGLAYYAVPGMWRAVCSVALC